MLTQHSPPRLLAVRSSQSAAALLALSVALGAASCSSDDAPQDAPPNDRSTAAAASAGVDPSVVSIETGQTQLGGASGMPVDGEPGDDEARTIDLTSHVPDNALAYFECESLDALEEAMLRYSLLAGDGSDAREAGAFASMPLVSVGVDPSKIDQTAPIAIAFAPVPGELFPAATVIVPSLTEGPIVNSVAALTARGMKARRIEGGYVVVEHVKMTDSDARGNAHIAQDLPMGLIRGRFNTQTFIPLLTPALYECADELNESYRISQPKRAPSQLRQFDADLLLAELRKPEEIAFGLELDGDRAGVTIRKIGGDVTSSNVSDSPTDLAASLNELAHHIDLDDPMSMLIGFNEETAFADFRRTWARFQDEFEEEEEDEDRIGGMRIDDEALESIGDSVQEMLSSFRPGAAVSFQFEPAKAHLAIYLAAKDASRAREAISLLLSQCELEEWGFEMALPIRSMLDRTLVEDYSVRFDTRRLDFDRRAKMREVFKTFLGDSTLHLKVATSDNHVLVLLGGDTTAVDARIRDFDSKGLADIDVVRAINAVDGADAATVLRTDFVQLFGQFAGLEAVSEGRSVADTFREIQRESGDDSASFTFWDAEISGDRILGAMFDIHALTTAFDAYKSSGL